MESNFLTGKDKISLGILKGANVKWIILGVFERQLTKLGAHTAGRIGPPRGPGGGSSAT